MSRIGKLPIPFPESVTVTIEPGRVAVKGPKGELAQTFPPAVRVAQADRVLSVSVARPDVKDERALWGLAQRLIANMVHGVTEGFTKKLEINGIGYQAAVKGNGLVLNVGYSHPVDFSLPAGITATVEKNVITIAGIDKQVVGEVAAQIRKIRPPEPYKGKGIKYADEVIRRKAGKQAKAAGAK
jgi:large subunit ribosomal protein L6